MPRRNGWYESPIHHPPHRNFYVGATPCGCPVWEMIGYRWKITEKILTQRQQHEYNQGQHDPGQGRDKGQAEASGRERRMNRQDYPAYKPSGIEWLGDIPGEWNVLSCKFAYSIQLGKMLQNEPQSAADVKVPYLKALHVQWETTDTSALPEMWASQYDIEKFSVRNGDLLVCEGGDVRDTTESGQERLPLRHQPHYP